MIFRRGTLSLLMLVGAGASSLAAPPGSPVSPPLPRQEIAFPAEPEIAARLPVERYSPHYVPGGNASEKWNYVFDFPSGEALTLQFMITNIGPGEFTAVVIAYLMPAEGEPTIIHNSRDRGEWRDLSDERGPGLEISRHRMRLQDSRLKIVVGSDRAELELQAEILTDMFRPGRLRLGDDHWYDVTVFAPRMTVSGAITWADGSHTELQGGRGIGIHTVTDLGEDELATSWLRIDTFDAAEQVSLFEVMTSREFGRRRRGFALRFRDDRLVGWSYRYGRRLLEPAADPDKGAYVIPRGIRFGAVEGGRLDRPGAGVDFRGEAELELLVRKELLSFLNSAALRFVLRLLTDPIFYQYRAGYELSFDFQGDAARTVTGEGLLQLYFVDDAPAVF